MNTSGLLSSVSALVAKRLAIRVQNDGVAAAIADDRVVASVRNELLSLVFLNEVFDRLANPFGAALWFSCLHRRSRLWAGYEFCFLGPSVFENTENWGVVGAGDYLRGRSGQT